MLLAVKKEEPPPQAQPEVKPDEGIPVQPDPEGMVVRHLTAEEACETTGALALVEIMRARRAELAKGGT